MTTSRRAPPTSSASRRIRRRRQRSWLPLLQLMTLLLLVPVTDSFSLIHQQQQQRQTRSRPSASSTRTSTSPFRVRSLTTTRRTPLQLLNSSMEQQRDVNENMIRVGCVVKVVAENLKAYQVPPAGYGSFSSSGGEFISNDAQKYMLIPVGLKGVVSKVYIDISAQTPIQVKFEPTNANDGEFKLPVSFLMHFHAYELQVVE